METQRPQRVPLGRRRAAANPTLETKLAQMALPLAPLVQLTTGQVHPAFPATLLGFWLLTDEQLDGLAAFYHQRTPCRWTAYYPCPITWRAGLSLEEKRRKIGKFIGLRGCDTPGAMAAAAAAAGRWRHDGARETAHGRVEADVADILRQSESEAVQRARREAVRELREEEMWRRKMGWY
ncbi:hypothetical protein P8C59_003952 [Phyllachora maydis]|uniref:Beta-xylosidase n=1 Tax=Phyllachora maydis TaxID=1825666 RepID=A0AAD9I1E3_9PEZI|nr:hypothetical protein P8C59_003952 [Phyllachora maydis]